MTFTHRLSRRMALLRDAATIGVLAVVASCDILTPVDTSGFDLAQVVVVPGSTTLEPNQNYQFSGYGRTKTGDSVAVAVVWSASGGTISSSGRYTADTLQGDYEVRATLARPGTNAAASSGSSVVKVRKLAQLLVAPVSVTLPTRGTKAFAAYGRLNGGDSVAVTVTWAATGGSISPAGLYTAGPTAGDYGVTASGRGFSTGATVTLTSIPVASVSVSPPSATLSIGATRQLSAVTKDSAGGTLTGRVVTWSSSNPTVASVSGSGLVTAIAAGPATITATSEGKNGTSAVTVQAPLPVSHGGYYVAPTGSPSGDGSAAQPWDLATALAQPAAVQPGDTIWLRGGTYRGAFTSTLTGTAANPIVVRQYPGERATIDVLTSSMLINGSYTWYWGFEAISSSPPGGDVTALNVQSPGTKLINLVVHDAEGNGIGFWTAAADAEIHGCLIYNNGRQVGVPNFAYGIYTQNNAGLKLITDNFLFHNIGMDIHAYSASVPVKNYDFDGNIFINTGGTHAIQGVLLRADNMENVTFRNNRVYGGRTSGWATFGPSTPPGALGRFSLLDNYIWSGATVFMHWDNVTATGNTFATRFTRLFVKTGGYPASPTYVFNNNSYFEPTADAPGQFLTWINNVANLSTGIAGWRAATGYDLNSTFVTSVTGKPTTNRVFVRPNQYEAGRANIAVFNWELLGTVSVDVSGVLAPGDRYEVRNVQDFFGTPVLSGTYAGGSLSIPMTGVTPPVPIGGWPLGTPPVTGPEFNAFVVLRTSP